ncbi:MAG: DUF4838 domain-containing protein, partial [Clostridia bacterium]|nr:DUF4838 domain-containing protein [Clostridia bacterium]
MKKTISFVLACIMLISALTFTAGGSTSDGYHGFVPGDANDDNAVTMKDVLLIRRYIAGLVTTLDIDVLAADVVTDNDVTNKDVLKIRRSIASLEPFPDNNEDGKYKVGTVTVGGRNISRYSILVPADADECMKYASRLLRNYISGACGITLNIRTDRPDDEYVIEFRLDPDDEYKLGDEGYDVAVGDDGNIVITCGRLRGAMYAAYYFLEKFVGWRFLNDDVEYLYENDNCNIPLGFADREVPQFIYRGLNQIGSTTKDFAPLRLNAVDAEGSGAATQKHYGGGVGNLYIHGHSYAYQEAVGMMLDKEGITDLDSPEAMAIFEVYGYNSDERDALKLDITQPCLTSDKTFDHIMAFCYLLYKERTLGRGTEPGFEYTYFSCSPNDNTDFCTCDQCKAVYSEEGSIAGTVFRMSNRVSEAMKEIDPRIGIYTIAYWDARNPPKYTRPNDDVCVCFCVGGCNNHTYDHIEECVNTPDHGNPRYPFKVWSIEEDKAV